MEILAEPEYLEFKQFFLMNLKEKKFLLDKIFVILDLWKVAWTIKFRPYSFDYFKKMWRLLYLH